MLPIKQLGKLNADLDLAFNKLTISKFPISQAKFNLLAKQGVIRLNNLQGNLFNGEFKTSASLDTKAEPALLTFKQTTHNIPVEKFCRPLSRMSPSPAYSTSTLTCAQAATVNKIGLITSMAT